MICCACHPLFFLIRSCTMFIHRWQFSTFRLLHAFHPLPAPRTYLQWMNERRQKRFDEKLHKINTYIKILCERQLNKTLASIFSIEFISIRFIWIWIWCKCSWILPSHLPICRHQNSQNTSNRLNSILMDLSQLVSNIWHWMVFVFDKEKQKQPPTPPHH